MASTDSYCEVVEYHHYHPPGVRRVLASGTSAFIGEVDDTTILKFTLRAGGDPFSLRHEHELLKIVGPHERIIAVAEGLTENGLYLERASHGSLFTFQGETPQDAISLQKRIMWCFEVAEAVVHAHSKNQFLPILTTGTLSSVSPPATYPKHAVPLTRYHDCPSEPFRLASYAGKAQLFIQIEPSTS